MKHTKGMVMNLLTFLKYPIHQKLPKLNSKVNDKLKNYSTYIDKKYLSISILNLLM